MEYLSLFKKYVITNDSECKKLYDERFKSESSFHFDFKIGDYEGFFFGHPAIYDKVSRIYKLDQEVKKQFDLLPNIAQDHYIKKCLIDEIQFSNEIEGVISTRKEINDILKDVQKQKPSKKTRLEGIVKSYASLLNNVDIKMNTSSDIRKIYDELLLHEISVEDSRNIPDGIIFRKGPVEVDNSEGESIHNGVYPEEAIITYMDNALSLLKNSDIEPLIGICIFHYLFGYIHPFYDGNGRISRFITSYLLTKILCPISALRISMTIKEKISTYYKAFKDTNDPRNFGDIGTFVDALLNIIIESQEKTILYAAEKNNQIISIWNSIKGRNFPAKENDFLFVLLQASLFSKDGLSINELTAILKMDIKTIRGYTIKHSSLIKMNNNNRGYLYSIDLDLFL